MDEVVSLGAAWNPDGGAPEPRVVSGDSIHTIVAYHVTVTDAPLAVLRFPVCQIVKFGYPNDEAQSGHPLYSAGLHGYGLFEVLNSSWIRSLVAQNRVAYPDRGSNIETSRHFVVLFHDSTLECLADAVEGRFADSWEDALGNDDATFTTI